MAKSTMELERFLPIVEMWDWPHMREFPGAGVPYESPHRWEFLGAMRDLIAKPGHDIHSVVPLVWHKGENVAQHAHPEHTIIFYVTLGEPPVPIILDDGVHLPITGEALILSPFERHEVPTSMSDTPRIALAMRVNKQ